ncbi:MAG: DUF3330 domain-containing protein [Sulfuriflexus sp.]|nr:DUF3330 domain-containing protein [Sulfuriflexus sp.]
MTDKKHPEETDTVSCEVCLKEVPASEARIEEASDYVRHFCGMECYNKWRHLAEKDSDPVP